MNNPDELRDKAMAGRLTPEEAHDWAHVLEEDAALGEVLRRVPAPPAVSTNFTARVLEEVRRGGRQRESSSWLGWLRFPHLARLAGTAVVVTGICVAVIQQRRVQEREVADSVRTFANSVTALSPQPEPEAIVAVFQDFDAIRRLPGSSSDVDYGLLAALRAE